MALRLSLITLVCWVGCGLLAQTTQPAGYDELPRAVAVIVDPRINEVSGIVASRRHADCFYVHNDSGGGPAVFLIDRRGQTRLTIRLKGAQAADYEDIALAPGTEPGTFDVCVADIGDNDARRPHVTIYRFAEPDLPTGHDATVEVQPRAYRLRYADGPADAEAFAVHPRTGDGYVITKRPTGGGDVYKFAAPWNDRRETVLPRLRALELPPAFVLLRIVTAADISPDGRRLAVRCYADGWEWRLPASTPDADFDRIFETTPVRLPLAPERQGEALCYTADGRAILTLSEGSSPTLYELPIMIPASQPAP